MEIDVVVPTLGTRREWLLHCINSIVGQASVSTCAHIVLPSQSAADEVGMWLREDAVPAGRIRYIVEPRPGLSVAINTGMRNTTSRYATWLGDDDLLAPNALQLGATALDMNSTAPFCYGQTRYIDATGKTIGYARPTRFAWRALKWLKDFVPQPGSLLRRESFFEVGALDESLRNAMDLDLFLKLSRVGRPIYLSTELSSYRLHATSITTTKSPASDEAESVRARYRTRRESRLAALLTPATVRVSRNLDRLSRIIPPPTASAVE